MIARLFRYWRALQRSTDMTTLWPACKEHAETLDRARLAFFMHAINDPAWNRDYNEEELIAFVEQLR